MLGQIDLVVDLIFHLSLGPFLRESIKHGAALTFLPVLDLAAAALEIWSLVFFCPGGWLLALGGVRRRGSECLPLFSVFKGTLY